VAGEVQAEGVAVGIKVNKFGVRYFSWKIFWKIIFHPLRAVSASIEQEMEIEGAVICDACGLPITEDQEDVGYECNLHRECAEG
jgi:hypothetical protein